jgi:multiple sugar transport system substrate-binding protein
MPKRASFVLPLSLALSLLVACSGPAAPSGSAPAAGGAGQASSSANPVDAVEITRPVEITFWHVQNGPSEVLQQSLIDEFMVQNPNVKIVPQNLGNYGTIYEKALAAIQAGAPPDVLAAYENQAADYYDADALIPFDDYINSSKYGLTKEELADYIPSYIEATKFPQYGAKQLTFPYTKSDLVLYTNMEVARDLGFQAPPKTWDEFVAMCRAAVAAGKQGFAAAVDASGFNGIIYSYGGDIVTPDGKKVLFDQPPAMKTMQLYETLATEKLAYQVQGSDDRNDILAGRTLFMMRSSTSVPTLAAGFKDDSKWAVSIIPQGGSSRPVTVLYGANISILKSTPEKQLASWLFIKWLTRPDVTARWGLDASNGYFPVRQSTLQQPEAQKFLDANQRFKDALEISRQGKVEPSPRGWAEIRNIIGDAMTGLLTQRMNATQARDQLMQRSTRALAQA